MTAISQRIPNFIGGVSQQADEKMLLVQVKDAVNCYPDITLGMLKRPGGKFLGKLASMTANTADQAAWFSMFRDNQEKYIATVSSAGVPKVWNLLTGLAGTVTYPAGKQASIESYLTAADYRSIKTLTINDFTYIVNSEKTVQALAAPTFTPLRQAVISLLILEHDTDYIVTINRTKYTYTTPAAGGGTNLTVETIMKGISNAIGYPSGLGLTKTIVDGVLVLTSTADMTVAVAGGNVGTDGHYLRVFNNSVTTISNLPEQCVNGLVVKVVNVSGAADDYYVKFVGTTIGVSGTYSQTGTTVTVTIGYEIQLAKISILSVATSLVAQTIKFSNGLVEDTESIRTMLLLNNKPLTEHNRSIDSTIIQSLYENTNWSSRRSRYYKAIS